MVYVTLVLRLWRSMVYATLALEVYITQITFEVYVTLAAEVYGLGKVRSKGNTYYLTVFGSPTEIL